MRGNGVEKKSEHPHWMFVQVVWLFFSLFISRMLKPRNEVHKRCRYLTEIIEFPHIIYISDFFCYWKELWRPIWTGIWAYIVSSIWAPEEQNRVSVWVAKELQYILGMKRQKSFHTLNKCQLYLTCYAKFPLVIPM